MSLYRRAPRRDGNEPEVVKAFTDAGCTVLKISAPNAPDLVVGIPAPRRVNALVEVKQPGEHLREGQAKWAREWRGDRHWIVTNAREAQALVAYYAGEGEP